MSCWPVQTAGRLMPLKHACLINPEVLSEKTDPEIEIEYIDIGNVTLEHGVGERQTMRFGDAPSRARKPVRKGDTIVSTVRTYLKAIAHIRVDCSNWVASTGFAVLRPTHRVEPRFLYRVIQSPPFVDAVVASSTGVSYPAINPSALGILEIPLPDLSTQTHVADFLDREIAHLDQLIEKKQRLVHLLKEREQAVINSATCKGLDPNVDFVDSSVQWFGMVPAHWTVCRFNRLISSKVDYRGRTPEKVDDGVFLVTSRNIRRGRIDYGRAQEYTTEEEWTKLAGRGAAEIGDVIFTTEAPLGEVANVDRTDVAFAQRIIKFRGKDNGVDNYYLKYLIMSDAFQRSLLLFASGSTAEGIKSERFAHLFGLIPPLSEQRAIVSFAEDQLSRIRTATAPVKDSVDRLSEFRSGLITAAVTGQIDVEHWRRRGNTDRRMQTIEEEVDA